MSSRGAGFLILIVITVACFAASQTSGFRQWQCKQINNEQSQAACLNEIKEGR